MANSLSNIQRTSFEVFEQVLVQGTSDFERVAEIVTTDDKNLTRTQLQGVGGFTAYSGVGTSITKDLLSGKVTFSSSPKAKDHKVTWSDVKNNPELPGQISAYLANQAVADIHAIFAAGIESLFSTGHPLAGTGAGQVGASKNFIDTALRVVNGSSGDTQSNLFTQALSRSALVGAIETMRKWRRVGDGQNLNLGAGMQDLVLCVGAVNEDLARSLIGSDYQSAEMQTNTLQNRMGLYVYPWATDDDDWFVVDRSQRPVGLWLRERPFLKVGESDNGLDLVFSCGFHADFIYSVEGAGIIGSNVA